ncbi:MAG: hypothetical protein JJE25_11160 [Bacteroidia bacterium]|nr:hypothetical protein [Bacteroidia bacterium]
MKRSFTLTTFDRQGSMCFRREFCVSGTKEFLEAIAGSGIAADIGEKHNPHFRIEVCMMEAERKPQPAADDGGLLQKLNHPVIVAKLFEKKITLAELNVIRWLLTGEPLKQLAERYCKSPLTLATQRRSIYGKLEINSLLELVLYITNLKME